MQNENLIPASEFCLHHNVEISFIRSLHEYGLIEITIVEENIFLDISELAELEKIIRLHDDLHINLEGLDAISSLLKRINALQDELRQLRNRIGFYENS